MYYDIIFHEFVLFAENALSLICLKGSSLAPVLTLTGMWLQLWLLWRRGFACGTQARRSEMKTPLLWWNTFHSTRKRIDEPGSHGHKVRVIHIV